VWVAFVVINVGDHDGWEDFLSVHATKEGAKKAVAEWVSESEGEDFDTSLAGWVEDPNDDNQAYYVGNVERTTYERIAAGDAEVFGTVGAHEIGG